MTVIAIETRGKHRTQDGCELIPNRASSVQVIVVDVEANPPGQIFEVGPVRIDGGEEDEGL